MAKFLIAGHVIAMEFSSPEVWQTLESYRYEGAEEPERVFRVTEDALRAAEKDWLDTYRSEIEEFMLSRQFCLWLAGQNGLYLHASAVAYEGRAYAFTADSGTGKSTHARLWAQELGAEILNDDKPLICLREGEFFVCGSPWCGKEGLTKNRMLPLRGVCFLSQGVENSIRPMPPREAVALLLRQTMLPDARDDMDKLLSLVDRLVRQVPLYGLTANISGAAVRVAYEAMRAGGAI